MLRAGLLTILAIAAAALIGLVAYENLWTMALGAILFLAVVGPVGILASRYIFHLGWHAANGRR